MVRKTNISKIMKNMISKSCSLILVAGLFWVGSLDVFAQKKPVIKRKPIANRSTTTPEKLYVVPAGTTMRVRINSQLSSKINQVGDTFLVTATEPVYSTTGVIVIPTGSTLTGKVVAVTPAKKGGNVGSIDCSFITVNLPNGRKKAINGSLSELDTNTAKSDNEGTAKGDRTNHRKVKFIGGGGVGGAVLGGVIGGGKGALIGAIIGGVGGRLEGALASNKIFAYRITKLGLACSPACSLPSCFSRSCLSAAVAISSALTRFPSL